MKLFQIVSLGFIFSFFAFASVAHAAIQFYGVDVDLNRDDNAKIKLTITFQEPVQRFQLALLGNVKNFQASSNSGPVNCRVATGAFSVIDCTMSLTADRRTLDLTFETDDFVKTIENNRLFAIDLSLSQDINSASASLKLPEGFVLTEAADLPSVTPNATNILSDGRRIIVYWTFQNITAGQAFKFQAQFEPLESTMPITLLSLGALGLGFVAGGILLYYRRRQQPKEVILSVLDDFEKKTIEIINNLGGETTQRKIVQETNLSKAKVSRVIKRLQERGLIEVIRLGRTNKLKLVKKKFEAN